jgi:hypothetical protein
LIGMPIRTASVGIPTAINNCVPFIGSFYQRTPRSDSMNAE